MTRFPLSPLVFAILLMAVGSPARAQQFPGKEALFTLSSTEFTDGGVIPARFTCDKEGDSPPLHWETVPEHVKTYAVTVNDPDAPKGTFTHWIAYNMPDNTRDVAAAAGAKPDLGLKAAQGMNSDGKPGWTPPCPPNGEHHYIFKVYALDSDIALDAGTTLDKKAFEAAIEGHVLGQAELTGRYSRTAH